MRIHRVYAAQVLEPESEVILRANLAHYLSRVLRVVPGQAIVLFNGDGNDYASEVLRPGKNEVKVQVLNRLPARPESLFRITLVQAISRGERMDQTLQKCTELGVAAFQPLETERVEVRIRPEKLEKRMDHWRQVIISACEQCGRASIPALSAPIGLNEWLTRGSRTPRLVLKPDAEIPLTRSSLETEFEAEILIGPEGGFSEGEFALMHRHAVRAVSLGPRILRTETAGPAAVAVIQALFGDFSQAE